jgi:peptidoglycan/xylan/chitin deacetylase (PgdA/CDA1 family)
MEFVRSRKPLPPRTIVLTFDDGFADFYSAAAPVMRRLGFPATLFVTTGYPGLYNTWPSQPRGVCRRRLLDWSQLRELAEEGFSVASHSVSHPALTELSPVELQRELAESRRELETRTGRSVDVFCYPYGRWNAEVRRAVEQEYQGACGASLGVVSPGSDAFALPRVDAYYLRHPRVFHSLFSGRFATYLAIRQVLRMARSRFRGKQILRAVGGST